jgi:EipB-like
MGQAAASWTAGRLAVAAVCGGVLAGTSGAALADPAANILPHRAGYELSLRSVRSGSGIIDVTGLLSYDWTDSCDGWIVEQRYVLQVVRGDGPVAEISASYANWESKDGLRYRFNVKRGRATEEDSDPAEVQGEASLKGKGKAGTARFEKPEKQEIVLPAGTLFPTEHTLMLIQKALAGEKFDRHPVFDGAEVEGPSMMTAFLLPKRDTPPGGKPAMLTAAQPVWPVTIAVFSEGDKSETPSFEMTIYLQENGVVPELIMDYGDFSVVGRMKIFEKLPKAEC